tara:strand:+ start:879 stop:1112 length:234 start_codon:yes stop_codon:yes gene_type:complete
MLKFKPNNGFKIKSPLTHKPWAAAHRQKVAHSGTAEAHGHKRGKRVKEAKPKKAHYGSDVGGGSQTYLEYAASLRKN